MYCWRIVFMRTNDRVRTQLFRRRLSEHSRGDDDDDRRDEGETTVLAQEIKTLNTHIALYVCIDSLIDECPNRSDTHKTGHIHNIYRLTRNYIRKGASNISNTVNESLVASCGVPARAKQ